MRPSRGGGKAFSLLELLVVIGIIGLLAGLAVPAIKNMRGNSIMNAATRQLLDDLGYARLKAISERTTVYVVFVPAFTATEITSLTGNAAINQVQLSNLFHGQLTSYGIFTERRVGAQPGRSQPDYITEWKNLPDGIYIPPDKFGPASFYPIAALTSGVPSAISYPITNFDIGNFPFPTETNSRIALPYVAFNSLGQLVPSGTDEYIPLARGSLQLDPGNTINVLETPAQNHLTNYNLIQINWITGRGKVRRPEF